MIIKNISSFFYIQVSDYNGRILSVVANHGGRTHDARVWSSSQLSRHMLNKYENGRRNVWLLGKTLHHLHKYYKFIFYSFLYFFLTFISNKIVVIIYNFLTYTLSFRRFWISIVTISNDSKIKSTTEISKCVIHRCSCQSTMLHGENNRSIERTLEMFT